MNDHDNEKIKTDDILKWVNGAISQLNERWTQIKQEIGTMKKATPNRSVLESALKTCKTNEIERVELNKQLETYKDKFYSSNGWLFDDPKKRTDTRNRLNKMENLLDDVDDTLIDHRDWLEE